MARPRLIAAALALLGLGACAPAASAALSADSMYEASTVVAIDLQLEPEAVAALEADPDEYVEGTFAIAETDGTPTGIGEFSEPIVVGVRLKGSASFEGLDGKAAFKVKFDEFDEDQTWLGLAKLTLNSMVQDASMVHEALAYDAFRAAGVAAPHAGYAYVHLNGIDYGLHLNLETLDKIALEKRFGPFLNPPQHLYEGVPPIDLAPGSAGEFEVDEGKSKDRADLEALIAAANAAAPGFSARLAPVADLDQMVAMWAAERYLGQWDGYSSPAINNYYLYSDAAGVFQMLPWGTDQMLISWWYSFTGKGGTLFAQCLAEQACLAAYREALAAVAASTAALDLPTRAQTLAARLAPWQALEIEQSGRAPYDAEEIAAEVERTLEFLAKRPGVLAHWLGTDEEPEDPGGPGEGENEKGDDGVSVKIHPFEAIVRTPPPTGLSNRLELDRAQIGRGLLIVRAAVSGPGSISLVGNFGPHESRRRACAVGPKQVNAGAAVLHCRLGAAARRRLAARPLTLRLSVGFQPADGSPALSVPRLARLPRQSPS